jgi:dethiobiotin synthetase
MSARAPRGLFVTGTDTGVGKTIATGVVAVSLRAQGLNAGVMKPVETGTNTRAVTDSDWLLSVVPTEAPREMTSPYRLGTAAAPAVAAMAENLSIELPIIVAAFQALASRHECIVVEGVGGAMVPLAHDLLVADLMLQLGLPVLIVARAGLGSINHTLLTVECLERRGIPILGILFNNPIPPPHDQSHDTVATILRWTGLRSFGELPHADGLPETWNRQHARLMSRVDIQGLLEALELRGVA